MDDFFKKQDEALQRIRRELAERLTKLLQEIHPSVEVHFIEHRVDPCELCGSDNTTEIMEGIINMPNVKRPRGVFCNGCGRQIPAVITMRSPGVGTFYVYEDEGT